MADLNSRQRIERDGFAGPFPRFAPDGLISELAEFFQDVLDHQPTHRLYNRYSVRDWHLVNESVRSLLTAPELVATLQEATGADDLLLWRSKLFEKFPGDGAIDWHQEYGYFDGEEVGNHRPALYPMAAAGQWDWTVWLPLTDVTEDDGVMEFVNGSHHRSYPKRMVKLTESGAYVDPRNRVTTKEDLVARAANNSLILDIDTRNAFVGHDVGSYSYDELFEILLAYCDKILAVVTEPFELGPNATTTVPIKAGEYIIFTERCMHRSRASLPTANMRLAVNGRYTLGNTWVYPQRFTNDTLDGSNLDIREHQCIQVGGVNFNPNNAYFPSGS